MQPGFGLPWRIAQGGRERQDSVRNALAALPADCDAVLVHDASRPFMTANLANRLIDSLESGAQGVIPGVAVVDTIKKAAAGLITETIDRAGLFAVQTPQGAMRGVLEQAHRQALQCGWSVTDDAALLERCQIPVQLIEGEPDNCKITRPEDLRMLGLLDTMPSPVPCSGLGYDVHRYAGTGEKTQPARPMRLGGVPITGAPEVLAHSDGDVLLHALMDALLGLCGQGDIGALFPDTDPALENIDSALLLDKVLHVLKEARIRIVHVDCTLVAQVPKLSPWREQIRKNLCRLLALDPGQVNVKATTEEGLGFTGEKKGIKAFALASGLRLQG
jgi:2-C-methyl-D-erythritol 4-phosphate cytidylyltransferase/2-C-methyl-D-erythritol 2,4-cyclodiphosphate synthase